MKLLDVFLLLVIAFAVIMALRHTFYSKKKSSCHGCSECCNSCKSSTCKSSKDKDDPS